jgi:hypothetical protein
LKRKLLHHKLILLRIYRLLFRALALRLRPAADIFAIFFLPYFLRPMEAASAFGFLTPFRFKLRLSDLNLFPEPNFALRRFAATIASISG